MPNNMAGRYDMASVMKKLTAMETDETSDGIHCTQKEKRKKKQEEEEKGESAFHHCSVQQNH